MRTACCSYRARWLFPGDAEPIENGTVEVEQGKISALHAADDGRATDLGNVAVIPGLVNAHTHLEFSDLREPLRPCEPFSDWVRAVVGHRRRRTADPIEPVRRGFCESGRSGTTLIAEITTDDQSTAAFQDFGADVIAFREILCRLPEQFDRQLAIAEAHLRKFLPDNQPAGVTAGISPHAPYSVHPELFERLVTLAEEFNAPLAIHVAETRAELELLDRGEGELVEMFRDFGLWTENIMPRRSRPLDYLRPLVQLEHVLIIHGNYLSDEEIDLLARHPNLAVVYCPRTHAYFGHVDHPWRKLLSLGASVAIGTDSRASNPDLSVWRELCFLRSRHPEVDPRTLLELGTINGARALGHIDSQSGAECGTLAIGKSANLTVVALAETSGSDAYSVLFDARSRIVATMRAGRWIGEGGNVERR